MLSGRPEEGLRLRLPERPLIVGGWMPPRPGGSSVILANLLRWFEPADFVAASGTPPPDEPRAAALPGVQIRYVSRYRRLAGRGHQLWSTAQIPLAARRLVRLAARERCRVIVGVFPDLQNLTAAYLAHRLTGLAFAAYLHDFMVDAGYKGYLGALARWLQLRVFAEARPLWTMSEAMSAHFRERYRVASTPLVHAYNEPIPAEVPPGPAEAGGLRLLFSGAVYAINAAPLARVSRAVARLPGARLAVFGANGPDTLARAGLDGAHVTTGFIARRAELIRFMQTQDAFVSCLAWPDESWLGATELATIFPTKVPEYLAQGRPILVHCPPDYFLARFVHEHDCGWVVSERSEAAIVRTIEQIRSDAGTRRRRCANALAVARRFAGDRVARQFRDELEAALGLDRRGAS